VDGTVRRGLEQRVVDYFVRFIFLVVLLLKTIIVCAAFGFSVFGATTCMLDSVRGKDKPFSNAIIGGFLGGFCAGTRGKFY